jgi:hypothetical protein
VPAINTYCDEFSFAFTEQPVFPSAENSFHSVIAAFASWALPEQGSHKGMLGPGLAQN